MWGAGSNDAGTIPSQFASITGFIPRTLATTPGCAPKPGLVDAAYSGGAPAEFGRSTTGSTRSIQVPQRAYAVSTQWKRGSTLFCSKT
jgi:hypothetical protein